MALSADGNTAIVGENEDSSCAGAAWVWARSGGAWTQQGTKLVGSGAVGLLGFGDIDSSVALSADGNTAIVGGQQDNSYAGAAWVWTRTGAVWTQQGTKLVGSGAVGNGHQGSSVSLSADGNTAIVGGPYDNNRAGAAWVWTRTGAVWTQQGTKLVGSGATVGWPAGQGDSVSLSADGNTAIVGGPGDLMGATWVWTRSGGVWTQQGTKLIGTGFVGFSGQGTSVSLSADGNTAIVGGPYDNQISVGGAGAAWVWTRSGGVWTQQGAKLTGSGAVGTDVRQGWSVSLSTDGNRAIVGGLFDNSQAGAAWVWARSGGVWAQQGTKLVGSGAVGNASQGASVALSADGNTAIVGGPNDNIGAGYIRAGAAWVFAAAAALPAPTVLAVSPTSGPTAGGTAVTVKGANFAAGATVAIGGVAATVFSISATTITATTPAHPTAAADVVVSNPDGQSGTLIGGFSFSDTPPEQTPPVRLDLPEDPGLWPTSASKAVVITHGWTDDGGGWVKEMANKVCVQIGAGYPLYLVNSDSATKACQANGWDVWIVDWRSKADTSWNDPMGAYVNAIDLGQNLASNFKGKNYSHIHFIAHSAGANLIDFATIWLKIWVTTENRPPLAVHETFLDAYDPVSDSSRYGKQADWADSYVDTRTVFDVYGLDGTKLFLRNGYNVDVTPVAEPDPCTQFSWLPDVYGCRHNRPYRFYGLSIDPSFVGNAASAAYDPIPSNGTGNMGFPLSVENGHSLGTLSTLYPKGAKCVMDGGICYSGSLPPSAWTFLPGALAGTVIDATAGAVDYIAGVGATLFTSLRLGLTSPGRTSSSSNSPYSTAATDPPSWITVLATTTQPVNTLRFNWRFEAAGEAYLRVFVDGILVREIDQRHVSLTSLATEEIYISGTVGALPAGLHRIAFRLDGFGTNTSGIELTGVELGYTAGSVATRFYVLTPCRLFDTRNTTGSDAGFPALVPGATRTFTIGDRCAVPASAKSLSVNQTVTGQMAPGELVLFRGDLSVTPNASSISFPAGKTRANNGILELSRDGSGTFKLFNTSTGAVHFILDVNGYFQ